MFTTISLLELKITKRQNAQIIWKWPCGPIYRFWPNFSKCSDFRKNHPLANWTVLNPFSGLNSKSNTPNYLKIAFKIFWDQCNQMFVQYIFFWYFTIPRIFSTQNSSNSSKLILQKVNSSQIFSILVNYWSNLVFWILKSLQIESDFSSDHFDPFHLLLNLGFLLHIFIYCFTSYS